MNWLISREFQATAGAKRRGGDATEPPDPDWAMSLPALRRGGAVGPFEDRFDLERVRQFSEATKQAGPGAHLAEVVPPGAAVTLLWAAQNAGRDALVPQGIPAGRGRRRAW